MSTPFMGIGKIGSMAPRSHKFRWTFEAKFSIANIPERFVKLQARPVGDSVTEKIEDIGKQAGSFTMTVLDVQDKDPSLEPLWQVIRYVYELTEDGTKLLPNPLPPERLGTAVLRLYDGTGNLLERWSLTGVWPTNINFGELDYSSSAPLDIEITWRYASFQYENDFHDV